MSFLEEMKKEANYTRTMNGAKTHRSTGDACLDVFAAAGGMRYRKTSDQIRLFDRAYIENPELAMKLLFYIRDIRGGLGERELFRVLIQHLARYSPESVKKNIPYIAEFGRWDDLLCLLGTNAHKTVVQVIKKQLEKDLNAVERRENGEPNASVSLLAKWLPSANTSSQETREQAKILINALCMDQRSYRKMLSKLRKHSCITERYLSNHKVDKIKYETVPAKAMLKHSRAFERTDKERFTQYLENVSCGKKKINCDTLFPYEIVRPYFHSYMHSYLNDPVREKLLEELWKNQSMEVAQENVLSVIDTSGSMYWSEVNGITPALISQALGIYYAERCTGPFHNHFITFESKPHLLKIHGNTLGEKIRYIESANWGTTTNLEAVFDLILDTALRTNAKQSEMPSVLYIISDMEFNCAVANPDKTVYENAKKLFEAYGYKLPAVVFHNVNSWQRQAPVTAHTKGAALTSGAGTASFQHKFDGNTTPMNHMLKVLNSKRYKEIHA